MSHGIPAFRNCNIRQGQIDATEWVYLRKEALIENPRSVVHYQDIIMARSGCPGIACSVPSEYDGYSAVDILIASVFTDYISSCFIEKNINSQTIQNRIAIINRGVALSHIGVTTIDKLLLPIPPFAEQQRIVSCIEQLFVLCDTIDKADENLENTVSLARQKVLDLAIRGQLVQQNPADEPASELLKRIQAEKAAQVKTGKRKADKRDSTIIRGGDNRYYENVNGKATDITDQIPFEIPPSWEWVRLPEIAESELGKTLDSARDTGIIKPYLCSINVLWNKIELQTVKQARFDKSEIDKYRLRDGDLLICEGGIIGRCAVWHDNSKEMYYQNALHRVRFCGQIKAEFFQYVLESFGYTGYLLSVSKGMTIKHLTQTSLFSLLFPLPPLTEQTRIVDAVSTYENLLKELL